MAITQCSDWIENDSRFKSWGKKITSIQHLNLNEKGGYALGGSWVRWDDSISVKDGEFLVCAAETGSRKSKSYEYRLIAGGDVCKRIEKTNRVQELQFAFDSKIITENQFAESKNNVLYSYALFIYIQFKKKSVSENIPINVVVEGV